LLAFGNAQNEDLMKQTQLEATDLTSRPAGTGKLCAGKTANSTASKLKKTRLFWD
jgi:hypothetical protein